MIARLAFAALLGFVLAQAQAPITIGSTDMPQNNVSYVASVSAPRPDLDFTAAGQNHTWDFTSLRPATQTADTFKSVSGLPLLLQLFYSPTVATSMLRFNADDLPAALDTMLPPMELTAYRFFSNNAQRYAMLGYGVVTDSLAAPLKFTAPDILHKFPMAYGNTDTSTTSTSFPPLGIDVGLGYSFTMQQTRVNRVDGSGTLKTPFGTFRVLRQVSVVRQNVTVISDTGDTQHIVVPTQTEYVWLGQGKGMPLLRVMMSGDATPVVAVIAYQDSLRTLSQIRHVVAGGFAAGSVEGTAAVYDISGRLRALSPRAAHGAEHRSTGLYLVKPAARRPSYRFLDMP